MMSAETVVVLILGILFLGVIWFLIWVSRGSETGQWAGECGAAGRSEQTVPPEVRSLRKTGRRRA